MERTDQTDINEGTSGFSQENQGSVWISTAR